MINPAVQPATLPARRGCRFDLDASDAVRSGCSAIGGGAGYPALPRSPGLNAWPPGILVHCSSQRPHVSASLSAGTKFILTCPVQKLMAIFADIEHADNGKERVILNVSGLTCACCDDKALSNSWYQCRPVASLGPPQHTFFHGIETVGCGLQTLPASSLCVTCRHCSCPQLPDWSLV